ncbi:MAG: hypothetical protein JXA52_10355 [Planctomycetes bacterium]|nr:hypothetical protein [Planctomycetota bacterium]
MKPKYIAAIVILSALVGGITGALTAAPRKLPLAQFEEIRADKITAQIITAGSVTTHDDQNQRCSMAGGIIKATDYVETDILKSRGLEVHKEARLASLNTEVIFARRFFAAENPLARNLNEMKINAQILGDTASGGSIHLHNKAGSIQPGVALPEAGYQLILGYDDRGYPIIFAEDNAVGEKGRSYVLRYGDKNGQPEANK